MKKIFCTFFLKLALALITCYSLSAQAPESSGKWISFKSDNGEFSIEAPDVYDTVYDKDGFTVSNGSSTHEMKNVVIFNSYQDSTLMSFESYETNYAKWASDVLRERDDRYGKFTDLSKVDGFSGKQITLKTDQYYMVREYIVSKSNLYIVTSASRTGETMAMKRFVDSVSYSRAPRNPVQDSALKFSQLRVTPLTVTNGNNKPEPAAGSVIQKKIDVPDPGSRSFVIVSKPVPGYTDNARENNVQGVVILKVGFTVNSGINSIAALKDLKGGLVRQAVFAVLRSKFLPPEKDGMPQSIKKLIEYTFKIL